MTPRAQLEKFMARYDPAIAGQAKKALAKLRKLVPGAMELVYDNYNALVIGFAPGDRASAAIVPAVSIHAGPSVPRHTTQEILSWIAAVFHLLAIFSLLV